MAMGKNKKSCSKRVDKLEKHEREEGKMYGKMAKSHKKFSKKKKKKE